MIKEKLKELEVEIKKYNDPELTAASDEDFEAFANWYKNKYHNSNIANTREFYKLANGFEFNGTIVYSICHHESNNIFDENKTWSDINDKNKFLFIGDADISWYCFNVINGKYHVLDKPSGDTVEIYDSLDELMGYIIDQALM